LGGSLKKNRLIINILGVSYAISLHTDTLPPPRLFDDWLR
jgi:hypothetical protein